MPNEKRLIRWRRASSAVELESTRLKWSQNHRK
jgi:hypothetical protein